ncbi:MAG: hypothetical protein CML24_03510 [Rhizobiales bacterium]|nr:hypothetical protein [Hyphomicrobiales bacterium]
MTLETLKQAGAGWSKILGRRPDWQSHFRFDAEGMNGGFLAFGAAVLVAIVLATLRFGFPPPLAMALVVVSICFRFWPCSLPRDWSHA